MPSAHTASRLTPLSFRHPETESHGWWPFPHPTHVALQGEILWRGIQPWKPSSRELPFPPGAERTVTLAELLVRLGSFGLDLMWHVECDELVDPGCAEMRRRSAGGGMSTLTLLSLATPGLRLVDAQVFGFAAEELKIVLSEVDSSLWDVRAPRTKASSRNCAGITRSQ